jgi:dihydropyrimidinase
MYQTIIRNGKVVTHTDVFAADVAIEDGKIAAIGYNLGQAKETIDAAGKFILPGCIDPHVHVGIFLDYEEDLKSETGAAAAGGTTTIIHYLIGPDPQEEMFNKMKAPISHLAYGDVAFHGILLFDSHLDEIERMAELGVHSNKFLMAYKGKAGEQIGLKGVNIDSGFLYKAFEKMKVTGGVPMIHAEHIELVFAVEEKFKSQNTLKTWADARPNAAEEIDLYIGCRLAEEVGVPIYQVHSSIGTAADIVREFRQRGNKVFLETCPHYLVTNYNGENLKSPLLGKINPPIRSPKDQEDIWKGVMSGEYDCIGTDSANNMYEKKWADGNIWNIVLDYSSVEYMLPMLLSEGVNKGKLSLPDVVRMTSYNTSRIFGLYPRKGVMAVGADADLVIVDLDRKKTLSGKNRHSISDYSLYEGWELTGMPVMTLIRGQKVVEDDKIVGTPGYGQFVPTEGAHK